MNPTRRVLVLPKFTITTALHCISYRRSQKHCTMNDDQRFSFSCLLATLGWKNHCTTNGQQQLSFPLPATLAWKYYRATEAPIDFPFLFWRLCPGRLIAQQSANSDSRFHFRRLWPGSIIVRQTAPIHFPFSLLFTLACKILLNTM